jgi:D-arabinose 1-dehydrogenase-like Zn-dependent alcohol dehydrogenase
MAMTSGDTYRAVQVVSPGNMELTQRPLIDPPAREVRIRVEACGVCHSDAGTVEGRLPIQWPRVPGHEAVGRIEMVGEGVEGWGVGDRVGVGFLGGSCGHCVACRDGDLVNCRNQEFTGVQRDGGYAEVMTAKASCLMSVPKKLSSVAAAPLLCAGLTTFSALRKSDARPGDLVAVLGVGGLGHLGVQYARHFGYEVVAIDLGDDKAPVARQLGAHHYIDSSATEVAEALQALGGAAVILAAASGGHTAEESIKGLRPGGELIVLGATPEPMAVDSSELLFGNRTVAGTMTGTPAAGDATLRFSVLTPVAAMIETMPLDRAPEAYERMMKGKARFRIVLTIAGRE